MRPMDTLPSRRHDSQDHVQDAFASLGRVIYAADSFDEVSSAIVSTAVAAVDGCDHASIMKRGKDGTFSTAVSSDQTARIIDQLEQRYHEGPCLDAIVDDAPHFEDDLGGPQPKWPRLAQEVVRLTPVRSVAGFRILAGTEKVGALNLFSDRVGGISERSADQAVIIAAFAAVSVVAMDRREEARTLARGLESNREIGKAVGLLMALHKVSDAEAFDLLRKASQDMNIKLADVAREVVQHHNGRPRPTRG